MLTSEVLPDVPHIMISFRSDLWAQDLFPVPCEVPELFCLVLSGRSISMEEFGLCVNILVCSHISGVEGERTGFGL